MADELEVHSFMIMIDLEHVELDSNIKNILYTFFLFFQRELSRRARSISWLVVVDYDPNPMKRWTI